MRDHYEGTCLILYDFGAGPYKTPLSSLRWISRWMVRNTSCAVLLTSRVDFCICSTDACQYARCRWRLCLVRMMRRQATRHVARIKFCMGYTRVGGADYITFLPGILFSFWDFQLGIHMVYPAKDLMIGDIRATQHELKVPSMRHRPHILRVWLPVFIRNWWSKAF